MQLLTPKVVVQAVAMPAYWNTDLSRYAAGSVVEEYSEELIGEASRASYQSDADSDRTERLIKHFLRQPVPESPLEFTWAMVSVTGISFAAHVHFARHRQLSQSWLSQRYTTGVGFGIPPTMSDEAQLATLYRFYEQAQQAYDQLRLDGAKKQDARYVMPQGLAMQGYMAGNARAWVQTLRLRRSKKAMPETRKVADLIAKELGKAWPIIASVEGWNEPI